MANYFFSDFTTPNVNANAVARVLSNEALWMIMQGSIETDRQGVTQRFSADVSGAEIRIIVPQPLNLAARSLGGTINGENFPNETKQSSSTSVGLSVLETIDTPVDIAQVTQDMIPLNLLEAQMRIIGMEVTTQLNALTVASKVANTFPAVQRGEVQFTVIDPANDTGADIRYELTQANSELDNGDIDNNLAYFPNDDRIMVIRPSLRAPLMKEGAIIVGGSNIAQEIVAEGGVSRGARRDLSRDAVIGMFDGLPVAICGERIWREACGFLGVPVYALDEVLGYISSGYANVRAVAQTEQMKIIDAPQGQGIRIQPLIRMGARSFYPKGNQFIVTPKFDLDAFITMAGGVIPDTDPNNAGNLLVRGRASRAALSDDASLTTVSLGGQAGSLAGTTYTITGVTAGASTNLTITPTETNAKVEVVNYKVLYEDLPLYAIGGINQDVDTQGKPAVIKVRVTAPNGTAVVYTLNVSYS